MYGSLCRLSTVDTRPYVTGVVLRTWDWKNETVYLYMR